jgi:hypothetical protein
MKKPPTDQPVPRPRKAASVVKEPREGYDFRHGVRGKYASRVPQGAALILLEPDVAAAFPTADAVHRALRAIMEVAPKPTRAPRKRAE